MNTPTDDEIVAHLKQTYTGGVFLDKAIREALRLARKGLPVKDDAATLWSEITRWDHIGDTVDVIRQFLTTRDAERDTEVAELVAAAKRHRAAWPSHSDVYDLAAALDKLERKP
jgi:hypothetical protein